MRKMLVLCSIIFCGVFAWKIGEALSSDALAMAVGFLFGACAGIPVALLVMASTRRSESRQPAYPHQPPIIMLAAPNQPVQAPPSFPRLPVGMPRTRNIPPLEQEEW